MSLLSQLAPKEGSTHYRKRVGRGKGSGLGQTSGKGHKGQLARTGGKVRRGFEGGQTPLMRRLPKFGFTNAKFKTAYTVVNIKQLETLSGEVDPNLLITSGLIKGGLVKILGEGTLTKQLTVKAHKFSEKAKAAIEAAGGKIEVIK
jgi:large subunit ribosomal protein L15